MSVEQLITDPALSTGSRRSPLRKLLKDPQAVITASLLLVIILLGIMTPLITHQGPNEASLDAVNAPIGTPGYLLGADQSGRDIYTRLLHSINTSMISAVIGGGVALIIGTTFGLIGGYFGKRLGGSIEWIFNLVMTFPGILLLIVLMPVTGGDYRATMLIFGVMLSPTIYRIVRNLVVGVKNELYVDAARVSGLTNPRILGRHVLFVVRGPIIIAAAFMAGSAIGAQSGLAFLGIGSTLVPSFGGMIADGFIVFYRDPTQLLWPSVALGVITASFVLFGNSLRDAFEGAKLTPVKIAQPKHKIDTSDAAADTSEEPHLLSITNLAIAYPTPTGSLNEVVSGVTLTLDVGQTLGLVGESGSGKTQTAFAALGVLPAEAVITGGSIRLNGRELVGLPERDLRQLRGRVIAYIPQEPMSNLDPSFTVGSQLVERLRATSKLTRRDARARVMGLLERVGIQDAARVLNSYPHQISGGMAQRVLIAAAVASRPAILIADEPTTALDVTVQAEILDLLRDLQEELHMAVLLVTHNFGVVADICDDIAVMQRGKVVEIGSALKIFQNPHHDYTKMLLGSILDEDTVRSDPPTLVTPMEGTTR